MNPGRKHWTKERETLPSLQWLCSKEVTQRLRLDVSQGLSPWSELPWWNSQPEFLFLWPWASPFPSQSLHFSKGNIEMQYLQGCKQVCTTGTPGRFPLHQPPTPSWILTTSWGCRDEQNSRTPISKHLRLVSKQVITNVYAVKKHQVPQELKLPHLAGGWSGKNSLESSHFHEK